MKIVRLEKYKETIREVIRVLKSGGLVVFPSDTVYILAVDPTNSLAVEKLLGFKNRWTGKAISVAVLDKKMAKVYVKLSENAENIYANLLPGPFTVVSKGKHKVAKGIEAENGTLGIRIPDDKYIHELVKLLGVPVTATSANLSGRTPHYSVESFLKTLSKKKREMIDLIVDAGKLPRNKPSTVIETTEPEIKILRRGDLCPGKSQTLISRSEEETGRIAGFLVHKIPLSDVTSELPPLKKGGLNRKPIVFGLSGDLGSGKTVFARAVGKYLGVKEKITSPTFVICNEYKIPLGFAASPFSARGGSAFGRDKGDLKQFLHFDLYRISGQYELEEIKFFDQFRKGVIACVEWPENMGKENLEKLKKMTSYTAVNFEYVDERTREIKFGLE